MLHRASGSSSPLGSACLARSRHNLHCSSSETWLDIAVTFDLLAGRGQIHWSFCGTQKTLTSGADFTQDSLDVLGSLLPLQNPLPFLCTSSSAMRPQTWWRRKRKFHGTQTGREPRKGTSRSFCRRKQRPGQGEVTGARRRPLGLPNPGDAYTPVYQVNNYRKSQQHFLPLSLPSGKENFDQQRGKQAGKQKAGPQLGLSPPERLTSEGQQEED
uniref:Uncharacterized protein LOC112828487 n=1 Tax=Callorhinus ursinus TaxID=34884 RepID=A0A3Q7PHU6_CALUR|nr:uncharacterized protein LOC112828487 [Callorhinus ursinus]